MIKNTVAINIKINNSCDFAFTFKEYYNRIVQRNYHLDLINIELAYNTEQIETSWVSSDLTFTKHHNIKDGLFKKIENIIMHSELHVAKYAYINIAEKMYLFVFKQQHNLYIEKTNVRPGNNIIMPALSIIHFWNNNYDKQNHMKNIYEVIITIFRPENIDLDYEAVIEENPINENKLKEIKNTIERIRKRKYQIKDIKSA